jgi:PAS domain-containing protein
VILLDPDGTVVRANEAALPCTGSKTSTISAGPRPRFAETSPSAPARTRPAGKPGRRWNGAVAGELFEGVLVEVARRDRPAADRIHRVRSLRLDGPGGQLHGVALVISDISGHHEAEERFERMFAANPAPP